MGRGSPASGCGGRGVLRAYRYGAATGAMLREIASPGLHRGRNDTVGRGTRRA